MSDEKQRKVVGIDTHRDTEASDLAERIRKIGFDGLRSILDEMFEGADDALFDMADKAESNNERTLHFDAMRILRIERPRIYDAFTRAMSQGVYDGTLPDAAPREDSDDFSLMPQDVVEEEIAVTNMVNKAAQRYRDHIAWLEDGLEQLAARPGVHIHKWAFSPRTLNGAFHYAMSATDLDIEVKLLVYKLFDRFVVARLLEIYEPVGQALTDFGFEPRTPRPKRRRKPADPARPEPAEPPPGQASQHYRHGRTPSMTVARWLERLAEIQGDDGARTGGYGPAGGATGSPGAGGMSGGSAGGTAGNAGTGAGGDHADRVFDALDALTEGSAGESVDSRRLLGALFEALGGGDAARGRGQGGSGGGAGGQRRHLARVARVFADLLSDDTLPPPGRRLLSRVRAPVFKSALLDESFFDEADHPARQLVNELAILGAYMDDENDPLYAELLDLVEQFVAEFEEDPTVIDLINEQIKIIRDRRTRELDRKKTVARIRRRAILELRQQIQDKYLPEAAKPFLRQAWGPSVCLRELRHGADSRDYLEGLRDLRRIVDALQPVPADTSLQERRDQVDAVKELADRCLREIRLPLSRAERLRRGLLQGLEWATETRPEDAANDRNFHLSEEWAEAGNDDAADTAEQPAPGSGVPPETEAESSARGAPEGTLSELTPDVQDFLEDVCRPTSWFRVSLGEDGGTRWLKVIEYDRDGSQVVFGNRRGETVLARDALALARDLQSGASKPVHDIPGFDNRLGRIIAAQSARLGH